MKITNEVQKNLLHSYRFFTPNFLKNLKMKLMVLSFQERFRRREEIMKGF